MKMEHHQHPDHSQRPQQPRPQHEDTTPAPRSSIEHLMNAIHAHEHEHPDGENENPAKRQKRTPPSSQPTSSHPTAAAAGDVQGSKKGRACTACRKLKVKCDSAGQGSAGCSRCQRLGLECINTRKLRLTMEGENDESAPSLQRLERAVEDILQRLKMPSLDAYSRPGSVLARPPGRPVSEFEATRENSGEPGEGGQEVAPAPMGSLYEVTQLNSLRSRLRRNISTQHSSSRQGIETDLIAQSLLTLQDAEELLKMYKTSLARYLFAITMSEDTSLQSVRESSTLLFTAVMLVSALHIPGKEEIHAVCHKHFLDLVATSMFERLHTLDDIRALCIAAFWQPDMSWKVSGLAVRMATELNLHQSFFTAFYSKNITEDQRKRALEKARLWYLLYVLDHHFSIAYGRPPVTAELLPIKEWEMFVGSPWCSLSDRRLVSQVSLFVVLSRAYETFGLEPERLMRGDDTSLIMHLRFTEDVRAWKDRWNGLVMPDKYVGDYPYKGVQLHYHFSLLVLNSLALRGRPLNGTLSTSLPAALRPLALKAIEAAHSILRFFLEESSYRESLVGVPLYLHSMIAFAVVFLIKLSHCWHTIGVSIDPEARTKPLIEGIIQVLKSCKAGNGHMVYSMANGFERMLDKRWGKEDPSSLVFSNGHGNKRAFEEASRLERRIAQASGSLAQGGLESGGIDPTTDTRATGPSMYHHKGLPTSHRTGPLNTASSNERLPFLGDHHLMPPSGEFGNISSGDDGYTPLQDDMLWSAGLSYDLLNTSGYDLDGFTLPAIGADPRTIMSQINSQQHTPAPAPGQTHDSVSKTMQVDTDRDQSPS